MRYGVGDILTSDGCVAEIGAPTDRACCPVSPCEIDPCAIACSFVEILPNGPLWDRAKSEAMSRYALNGQDSCGPSCYTSPCSSLADYAVYSGFRVAELIRGPLWSALREATPDTAVETIDSWLRLYGWHDAWDSLCRDRRLGPSPFECGAPDDPGYENCDVSFNPIFVPDVPETLDLAVKRGIIRSVSRLQMAPIKNLCGINWVLEPLGAFLRPMSPLPALTDCCKGQQWEICSIADTLEPVPPLECIQQDALVPRVQAWFTMPALVYDPATFSCVAAPSGTVRVWPGIMAAQRIALSMFPKNGCDTPILRCEDLS